GRFVDAAGLEAVGPLLGLGVLLLAAQRRAVGPPRVGTAAAGPAATAAPGAGRAGGDGQLGLGGRAAAGVADLDLLAGLAAAGVQDEVVVRGDRLVRGGHDHVVFLQPRAGGRPILDH